MTLFLSDPKLLRGFRRGDRSALEKTYRFYGRDIERYLRALASRAGARELCQGSVLSDLIQDVFIRAFGESSRASYDGVRPFGPYLRRIARNRFIDALRSRRKEVPLSPDDLPLSEPAHFDPMEGYDPEVLSLLEGYLNGLPGSLRVVYEERFVNGRSQAEASAVLGMSRSKLRTREERIRRGLRKLLARSKLTLAAAGGAGAEAPVGAVRSWGPDA
jgi:RNA polymerase sigma-70 factor (ECF subfamily)